MTGTAYFLAVVVLAAVVYLVTRRLRQQPGAPLAGALPALRRGASLTSADAITRIARAVRFEAIGQAVAVSPYVAVSVPTHLYEVWESRMDSVAAAVAEQVNKRGAAHAARSGGRWQPVRADGLHYFLTEGEFRVETSFDKGRMAAGGSLGEHGEAAFQTAAHRSFAYGRDPQRWSEPGLRGPAPTRQPVQATNLAQPLHAVTLTIGGQPAGRLTLTADRATALVGRGLDCDLVVPDTEALRLVSTQHLRVTARGGHVEVTDMSSNGSYRSSGARLPRDTPVPAHDGEALLLGAAHSQVAVTVTRA